MKRASIESILVMLLFILFTALTGLLIVEGQQGYESVLAGKERVENERIALSFIGMKVRQHNSGGSLQVLPSPYRRGDLMIDIVHTGPQEGMTTHILYHDGILYECYQLSDEPVDIRLGEAIVALDKGLAIAYDETTRVITASIEGGAAIMVHAGAKEVAP